MELKDLHLLVVFLPCEFQSHLYGIERYTRNYIEMRVTFQSHLYGIESTLHRKRIKLSNEFQSHLYGIERGVTLSSCSTTGVSIAPLWN